MLRSIAEGLKSITVFLVGADRQPTNHSFRYMGVRIEGPVDGRVTVHGVGIHGLKSPSKPLDLGNTGTSMRLLSGLLAGQGIVVTLVGVESLS